MLQRITKDLRFAILLTALPSLALLLIPVSNLLKKAEKPISVLIALMFWAGLILSQYFFWKSNKGRKKMQKKAFGGKKLVKPSPGIITFFSSKEATICDAAFALSSLLTILVIVLKVQNLWLVMLVLALLVLSFPLHCIFNGTTYRYIKVVHKIKKEPKRHENT